MAEKKSIAVIGQGFVGGSLTTVFAERGFDVYTHDKDERKQATGGKFPETVTYAIDGWTDETHATPSKSTTKFAKACEEKDGFTGVYFVCLPTPMIAETGECDISIVENTLDELSTIDGERIAVVKSTVPPGSTERWNKKYEKTGLRVIFNPEFLTEANSLEDMRHQDRIILGGPRPHITKVKQLFGQAFPEIQNAIKKTSSTTAEMVKYVTNVHLAARVVLSCEFAQICERLDDQGLNIDYDKVQEYSMLDKRLGGSHMAMPEIRGARGHCFPKDLAALVYLSKQLDIVPNLMEAIKEKNLSIVAPKDRDWEQMDGRAIVRKTKG